MIAVKVNTVEQYQKGWAATAVQYKQWEPSHPRDTQLPFGTSSKAMLKESKCVKLIIK